MDASDSKCSTAPKTQPWFLGHDNVSLFSLLQLFFLLWPADHFKNVVLPAINASLAAGGQPATTCGEFYRWIGLWLLMSLHPVSCSEVYWSSNITDDDFSCKLRLNRSMAKNRFKNIKSCFCFVQESTLPYRDKFYQLRQWQVRLSLFFFAFSHFI